MNFADAFRVRLLKRMKPYGYPPLEAGTVVQARPVGEGYLRVLHPGAILLLNAGEYEPVISDEDLRRLLEAAWEA